MEEVELAGREAVVADPEAQQVAVEGQQRLHVLDVQHGVAHAERPGAEARDRPPRHEGIGRHRRAVERLQAVARRVPEEDQVGDGVAVRRWDAARQAYPG